MKKEAKAILIGISVTFGGILLAIILLCAGLANSFPQGADGYCNYHGKYCDPPKEDCLFYNPDSQQYENPTLNNN